LESVKSLTTLLTYQNINK